MQGSLFDDGQEKYIRHDAITDFILKRAREQYGTKVQKEDIFYYVYGFLHCPAYRETFANDLKKMLPRLPLVENAEDFWAFSRAGRELADLHLNYEQIPATKDVIVDWHNMLPGLADNDTPEKLYHVEQMLPKHQSIQSYHRRLQCLSRCLFGQSQQRGAQWACACRGRPCRW